MTDTRFPDGIDVGSEAGVAGSLKVGGTAIAYPLSHLSAAGKKAAAGTVTVPLGAGGTAFASGLTTIDYLVASVYRTDTPVAGYVGVAAQKAGGSVTLVGVSSAGTVSTANGTATWLAIGS